MPNWSVAPSPDDGCPVPGNGLLHRPGRRPSQLGQRPLHLHEKVERLTLQLAGAQRVRHRRVDLRNDERGAAYRVNHAAHRHAQAEAARRTGRTDAHDDRIDRITTVGPEQCRSVGVARRDDPQRPGLGRGGIGGGGMHGGESKRRSRVPQRRDRMQQRPCDDFQRSPPRTAVVQRGQELQRRAAEWGDEESGPVGDRGEGGGGVDGATGAGAAPGREIGFESVRIRHGHTIAIPPHARSTPPLWIGPAQRVRAAAAARRPRRLAPLCRAVQRTR